METQTVMDMHTDLTDLLTMRKILNAQISALQKKIRKAQQVKPITITEVVLDRAEGSTELCKEFKFEGVSALAQANQTLKDWAADMELDRLGYDKVDFTLFLSNGDSYEGRFDMKPSHRLNANLIDHIVSHLEWVVENGEMIGAEHTKMAVNALPLYRSFR